MSKIAGYHLTWQFDRGDAWVNAVDPWKEDGIAHKECAWNNDALDPLNDITDLVPISFQEAEEQGHICDYCEKLLTTKQYYRFQAEPLFYSEPALSSS